MKTRLELYQDIYGSDIKVIINHIVDKFYNYKIFVCGWEYWDHYDSRNKYNIKILEDESRQIELSIQGMSKILSKKDLENIKYVLTSLGYICSMIDENSSLGRTTYNILEITW